MSHGGVGVSQKYSACSQGCGIHTVSSVENSWDSRNWVYSWDNSDVVGVVCSGKALVEGGLGVSLVAVSGVSIRLALGLPLNPHPHPHVVLQTHIHGLHLVDVVIQSVLLHLLAVVHPHPLVVHVQTVEVPLHTMLLLLHISQPHIRHVVDVVAMHHHLVVVHGILEHTTLLKVVPLVAQHVDCLLLLLLVQAHSLLLLLNHLVLAHDAVLHLSTHLLHVGLIHQLLLLSLLLHPAVAVHPVEQGVPVVCHLLVLWVMCHDGVGEGRVSLRLGFALAKRVRSSSENSTIDLRPNWAISIVSISVGGYKMGEAIMCLS